MKKAATQKPSDPDSAAGEPRYALAERYVKLMDKSKAIFRDACNVEDELLRILERTPENRFQLPDGRMILRRDNFAEKNTFFKQTAAKRFEVVVG